MGTEGFYPPYNFIDEDGEVAGFERELGDELCRRSDLECTWMLNDWETIIPNLVAGNYDTIMAGMGINDERDEVIDFTQPYIPPSPSVYIVRSGVSEDLVSAVLNGDVDAALVDSEFANDRLAANDGKLTILGPEVILSVGAGIGVREGDDELRDNWGFIYLG